MTEDIVLRFWVSYLNSTLYLYINFHQKIQLQKLVGHQWIIVERRFYTVWSLKG